MSDIVQFEQYQQKWRAAPPLVFIDMLRDQIEPEPGFGRDAIEPVLAKCRALLEEARERHWPVAFVRSAARTTTMRRASASSHWIEGFEPKRADMVFDRSGLSCYSNDEFANAMDAAGCVFVLAGFSGESSCLATLIDAAQNNHFVGLVQDASATRPLPGLDAAESHRAVLAVSGRYATIVTAEHWIDVAAGTAHLPQKSNVSNLR
jgi:nicotinamidase-related amidase